MAEENLPLIKKKATERNSVDDKPISEEACLTSVLSFLTICCYSIFCEQIPEDAEVAVDAWKQFP